MGKQLAFKVGTKVLEKVQAKQIIALKKQTPLKWITREYIEVHKFIRAQAHYLYWACFRGHVPIIRHILEKDQISPFARVYEGRSALMASLLGKHKPVKVRSL